MKTTGISRIETSIYVEYIQNYINESLSGFHEKCASEIERTSFRMNSNALSQKSLKQMVNLLIVLPYTAFIENLIKDINEKLCACFGLEQGEFTIQTIDCSIFEYHLNSRLTGEYASTEKWSELMEKLINKAFDFTCLDQMQTPVMKKFADSISVGSIFMNILGLDSNIHRKRHRQEFCSIIKGIGKNINIRFRNLLQKQYTVLIYQITEEIQEIFSYEQAI